MPRTPSPVAPLPPADYTGWHVEPDPAVRPPPPLAPAPPRKKSPVLAVALALLISVVAVGAAFTAIQKYQGGRGSDEGLRPGTPLWLAVDGVQAGDEVTVLFNEPGAAVTVPAARVAEGLVLVGVPILLHPGTSAPMGGDVRIRVTGPDGTDLTSNPNSIRVAVPLPTYQRMPLGTITSGVLARVAQLSAQRLQDLQFVATLHGGTDLAADIAAEKGLLHNLVKTRYFVDQILQNPAAGTGFDFGTTGDGTVRRIDSTSLFLSDGILADWLATLPDDTVHVSSADASDADAEREVTLARFSRAWDQMTSAQSVLSLRKVFAASDTDDRALALIHTSIGALKLAEPESAKAVGFIQPLALPALAAQRVVKNIMDVAGRCFTSESNCDVATTDQLTAASGLDLVSALFKAGGRIVTMTGGEAPFIELGQQATDMLLYKDPIVRAVKNLRESWTALQQGGYWLEGRVTGAYTSFVTAQGCGGRSGLTADSGQFWLPVPKAAVGSGISASCSLTALDAANDQAASDPMVVDLRDHAAGVPLIVNPMTLKGTAYRTQAPAPTNTAATTRAAPGPGGGAIVGSWTYVRTGCDQDRQVWTFGADGTFSFDEASTNSCDKGGGGAPPAVGRGGCKYSGTYTADGATLTLYVTWHGPTCQPTSPNQTGYTISGNALRFNGYSTAYVRS